MVPGDRLSVHELANYESHIFMLGTVITQGGVENSGEPDVISGAQLDEPLRHYLSPGQLEDEEFTVRDALEELGLSWHDVEVYSGYSMLVAIHALQFIASAQSREAALDASKLALEKMAISGDFEEVIEGAAPEGMLPAVEMTLLPVRVRGGRYEFEKAAD